MDIIYNYTHIWILYIITRMYGYYILIMRMYGYLYIITRMCRYYI